MIWGTNEHACQVNSILDQKLSIRVLNAMIWTPLNDKSLNKRETNCSESLKFSKFVRIIIVKTVINGEPVMFMLKYFTTICFD